MHEGDAELCVVGDGVGIQCALEPTKLDRAMLWETEEIEAAPSALRREEGKERGYCLG